ncbi:MAG TPA: GMP synthase (glutamine-hydrolyzing), partial [Firmicutes bacterium]|nr:GMP synthase (glutamine-hydrolyzing) [Bacillota bacterium]
MTKELAVIIDFGGPYTQLIARRIRELKVYCEILPYTVSVTQIQNLQPQALILSGGVKSVSEPEAPAVDTAVYQLGVPILGICYGMQLMARDLGGVVKAAERREYEQTQLVVQAENDLFAGLGKEITVWLGHGDVVVQPPPGFTITAAGPETPVAAMADSAQRFYAVQFHPEVENTPQGSEILENFLFKTAGFAGDWTTEAFIDSTLQDIRAVVGENEQVVCGLSGGVDSSVAVSYTHL